MLVCGRNATENRGKEGQRGGVGELSGIGFLINARKERSASFEGMKMVGKAM